MKDDTPFDPSREKLKAQTLKMVGRIYGISREDAESIYCQVMHEPPPPQLSRELTLKGERPTTPGLYWYRRHAAEKPVIVQMWKAEERDLAGEISGSRNQMSCTGG
ncbi:MAG: hypothetical protein NDI90_19470 [Nitrospira sp. BO4]|jgi:hypothetical protein|nr:hypothetical protein [Nitrospira sp. BO4]